MSLYKKPITSLNGLTNWMYNNITIPVEGDMNRYNYLLRLIVNYALKHIPGFERRKGVSLIGVADYIARKVQKNGKFKHFTEWVLEQEVKETLTKI